VFCLDCILRWLETQDSLGEDLRLSLWDHIVNTVKDPLRNPEAFVGVAGVVNALQLQFSCPSCRSVMRKRPIPAVTVEEVMRSLGLSEGSEVEAATADHLRQANGAFERYLLL
jgi:hypothetical protein